MWRARDRIIDIEPEERDNHHKQLKVYPSGVLDETKENYSADAADDVDSIMGELSQCITFDESKNATRENRSDGTHTHAWKEESRALSTTGIVNLQGMPSTVYYETDMYFDLLRATRTPLTNSDVANLLTLRF